MTAFCSKHIPERTLEELQARLSYLNKRAASKKLTPGLAREHERVSQYISKLQALSREPTTPLTPDTDRNS